MSQSAREAYDDLIRRSKEITVLRSCADVLGWDEQTYMPPAGAELRGEQMAILARMSHALVTAPVIGELLGKVEGSDVVRDADSVEAANVREIRRGYDRAVKVPQRLVSELARVTIAAQQAWRQARRESNFAGFLPHLEKIVALKREEAQAVGAPSGVLYDALLDEYEPGATTTHITRVFADLRKELVPLVAAIAQSGKKPRDVLHREYPVDRQKLFSESAAAAIGFDFNAGRLDVTTHPFCSGFGPGDTRITTRYNPRFFNEAFFGVLHEAGHALYEQGLDPHHFGTPSGSYCSLGIHESQSRLWENQVGRGPDFWEHFFPRAQQAFPTSLRDVSREEFVFAINDVQPSFIRVEADEATYNMHIILRFELEQDLISGNLKPADVPGVWNDKFEKSFGLKVLDDAHGCLQDIHWSGGGIGYFPTYTLGNLYAAQFMEQARHDLPQLDGDFHRGEFGRLKGWLNEKVHKPGRRFVPGQLCERITGRPLEHAPLMKYLRGKYASLYGI